MMQDVWPGATTEYACRRKHGQSTAVANEGDISNVCVLCCLRKVLFCSVLVRNELYISEDGVYIVSENSTALSFMQCSV